MEEIDINNFDLIRRKIKNSILQKLSTLHEVKSITFVGSFVNANSISVVSDIDIIVIIDKLDKNIFEKIEERAKSIKGIDCGLDNYGVKLNMSFGPLKFNDLETIVFHIMVYDIASHINHVLQSPFTCYDWQYFKSDYGKNLDEIYSAHPLQISDLIGTRRGLNSYKDDLNKGVISYRSYLFDENTVTEQKHIYQMDDRHKKEFAYHILKFLMLNILKILTQENRKYTDNELITTFTEINHFNEIDKEFFIALSDWKHFNKTEPANIIDNVLLFIDKINTGIEELEKSLPSVVFIRHAKTILNDGSFLGIGRDPEILDKQTYQINSKIFDIVYTGTLKRTKMTGSLLVSKHFEENPLLNEINYGLAEGLTLNDLKASYPDIIDAWNRGEDPNFPSGECQKDVLVRLNNFIEEKIKLTNKKNIAVVTHNIVLRTLLGVTLKAETNVWYKLMPEHFEEISFRLYNSVLIPNLTNEQRIKFKNQLSL